MASYHLSVKILSRSSGRSGVAAAAYRARTKIYDERQGMTFDYSKKEGLVWSRIELPQGAPSWMKDREKLWNAVEAGEKRKDAQIFREIEIALPKELDLFQQKGLVLEYVEQNFVSKGMVADINFHQDQGNPHAHIMLTMREIKGDGFGQKVRAWNQRPLVTQWRKNWADLQNQHLLKAGHDITVDHRSYRDRGIDIEPQIKMGPSGHNSDQDLAKVDELRRIMRENGEKILADPYLALKTLSHHNALFTDDDIYKFVHAHSDDAEQFRKVCDAIYQCDELVSLGEDADGLNKYTAQDLIDAEKQMLSTAKALSGRTQHKVDEAYIGQAIATRTMNADQEKAFRHLTEGGDAAAVIGYAGTGKSYTLGAVREAYEAQGYRVQGMALSGIAAEGLEHGSGIKSATIHRQMYSWDQGFELPDKKSVIVVDEAGMVGTRQMHRLTEYARNAGAKLILVGDYDQLQPIEAGGSFRGIIQEIGSATIGEIMRQKTDWQKEATKLLSGNREQVAEALDRYDGNGHIKLSKSLDQAKVRLIDAWKAKTIGAGGAAEKENIILAYRNTDVRDLNQMARDIWRDEGRLIGDAVRIDTAKGKRDFAEGDRILFLKNEYSLGVRNGSLGTLEAISDGAFAVRLDSGKTVAFDPMAYKSFDHGYAATIHKSQGVTVDSTFVLATRHMDKHAAYVALSRHKYDVQMFAGIDAENPKWDTFKDYGHMKMMLSRDGKKELVRDYGVHRDVEVDLGKIYKKGFYEITVSSDQLKKQWTRTQIVSGKLNTEQHRQDLREKAQAFADKAAKVTGVDKRSMSIKVEAINDDRFVALNEKWQRKKDQDFQKTQKKSHLLNGEIMGRINWPPFHPAEQERLLAKYNQRYFSLIRFADKGEAVQGEFHGDYVHKGVRVGAIDTGREGRARYTLVPFAEELNTYKGKSVRYDLSNGRIDDRIRRSLRMTLTDPLSKRSVSETVTIEYNGPVSVEKQKAIWVNNTKKLLGPETGRVKASFKELNREQRQAQQLKQTLSQDKGLKL
jgi:Ti-type conjugative transfer relaxase TraA